MTPLSNHEISQKVNSAIAEYLEIGANGPAPEAASFLARHAEIADQLKEFLADYHAAMATGSYLKPKAAPTGTRSPADRATLSIQATCPNGHLLRVSANWAGRRAKCPKCKATFVIPTLASSAAPGKDKSPTDGPNVAGETMSFKSSSADDDSVSDAAGISPASRASAGLGSRFGQFELIALLGEGGFGAVYRAHDVQLDRDVALKLPRSDALRGREELARFLREAQAAAQLHHPNIVSVYGAGQIDGIYYIESAYIQGESLRQKMDSSSGQQSSSASAISAPDPRPFTFREVAALISKLASALNYAHQRGIFHRDVKPANIMLDSDGQPHLMDFGLARRLEGDTLRTMEGIKMGTPAYMSPEQAKGESHLADARSDLWSLGVILYELLAGRLPFESKQLESLLTDILQREPEAPRKIDKSIPKDLETICLNCLAKEPVRRYPTCQHLADELERWLRGESIAARPVGPLERSWRWAKRRPAVAALSAVLLAVVASMAVIAPIVAVQQSLLRQKAADSLAQQEATLKQLDATIENQKQLLKERNEALDEQKKARRIAEEREAEAQQAFAKLDEAHEEQKKTLALVEKTNAELRQTLNDLDEARLGQKEAQELAEKRNEPMQDKLARGHLERAAKQYRDGKLFDAIALAGLAYKTDPPGQPLHEAARSLIAGWSTQIGRPLWHTGGVFSATFSPDGNTVMTGSEDRNVRFWDVGTGMPLTNNRSTQESAVRAAVFNPDGTGYLTATQTGVIQFWRPNGNIPFELDRRPIYAAAFSLDGNEFVVASDSGLARKWNLQSKHSVDFRHDGMVFGATFSPDGKLILTASADGTAQLWDASNGAVAGKPIVHPKEVSAVAFHPDGRSFLTGCYDGTVRQWSTKSGAPLGKSMVHKGRVFSVGFSLPDGRSVITGCEDGTARIWDPKTGKQLADPMRHGGWVVAASFSADGRMVLTASGDRTARLWPSPIPQPLAEPVNLGTWAQATTFSSDAQFVAAGGPDDGVSIWDVKNRKLIGKLAGHEATVTAMAFSADAHLLLTASEDCTANLWDTKSQQPVGEPLQTGAPIKNAALSPDGVTIFTSGVDGSAELWNPTTGKSIAKLVGHKQSISDVTFSSDGKKVLTGSSDGSARLWDVQTGQPIGEPFKHTARVLAVALSPDGKTVLTGCSDQTAHLWSAESGKPLAEPTRHGDDVTAVAFSPDGRIVVTGGADGRVCFWDSVTGYPFANSVRHDSPITALAFRNDGRSFVAASNDGVVRQWKVPQAMPDNPKLVDAWVVVHTHQRVDDQGLPVRLDEKDWKAAQEMMKSVYNKFEP